MTDQKFNPVAVAKLYDDIADVYAGYYTDYDAAVRKQGHDLAGVLGRYNVAPGEHIFDCSCGIGTQAIGIALQGYKVSASDISPKSIEQAQSNARKFGVDITLSTGDMRTSIKPGHQFGAVISCGNSLAHLLEISDMEAVLSSAKAALKPGGVFLAALTDHENGTREENKFYDPHVKSDSNGRTINFQLWTWIKQGEIYICDDYTIVDEKSEKPELKKVSATFRIWRKDYLFKLAHEIGFKHSDWLLPADTGHHNPIFCAVA